MKLPKVLDNKKHRVVDGIKYTKIGDDEYYAQELFESEELTGYLNKNLLKSKKSVYEYVVFDSFEYFIEEQIVV